VWSRLSVHLLSLCDTTFGPLAARFVGLAAAACLRSRGARPVRAIKSWRASCAAGAAMVVAVVMAVVVAAAAAAVRGEAGQSRNERHRSPLRGSAGASQAALRTFIYCVCWRRCVSWCWRATKFMGVGRAEARQI